MASMEVDNPPSDKKRFEVKKWNAVALWAWGKFDRNKSLRSDA